MNTATRVRLFAGSPIRIDDVVVVENPSYLAAVAVEEPASGGARMGGEGD